MDEALKTLLTILGTAGGSAFVVTLVRGMGKWLSGAAHREQVKNTSLAKRVTLADTKRDEAEAERDLADVKRREAEEHVAILKSQIRGLVDPVTGKSVKPLERPE
jgi:hypothetical protein